MMRVRSGRRAEVVTEAQAEEVIARLRRRTGETMRMQQKRLGLRSRIPLREAMIKVLGSEGAYVQLLGETACPPRRPQQQW
jgi:hypothetical protein